MEVIPAVDLRGGRCVRLVQGDYDRETVFSDDPVAVARRWADLGAPRLHVADLDGAREGTPLNEDATRAILHAVRIPVQVSGGVRTLEAVDRWIAAGAQRVVLGTAVVAGPSIAEEAVRRYGGRIVVSIDAKDGLVATDGWKKVSDVRADDLLVRLAALGVQRFVYTDIGRDGTLTSPNYEALVALMRRLPVALIAAGGVAEVAHLVRLGEIGVEGVIVGRSLYDGRVDLPMAMAATARL
ncbi:MAG: 1-(5-phosphoribosyl)-5-[(5-phosphoribosylamino)methylideneamino]imidazole-4-carboxamide isomerase [Dehalococcoidia bacterium]